MVNHPNRKKNKPEHDLPYGSGKANPTPAQVLAARGKMTQEEAAALIYATRRSWQDWELGSRRMHPGLFELFNIKLQAVKNAGREASEEN